MFSRLLTPDPAFSVSWIALELWGTPAGWGSLPQLPPKHWLPCLLLSVLTLTFLLVLLVLPVGEASVRVRSRSEIDSAPIYPATWGSLCFS